MQTEKCHTQPPITNPNSFSKGREVNIAIPPLAVTGYLTFLRLEYKYRVPYHFLDEMREAIAPFMRLDKHGRGYEQVSIFDSCF